VLKISVVFGAKKDKDTCLSTIQRLMEKFEGATVYNVYYICMYKGRNLLLACHNQSKLAILLRLLSQYTKISYSPIP